MNLDHVDMLDREEFKYSMCRFIAEVRKKKGDGDFPGKILYQLCVAIQKHLRLHKIMWRIIDGPEFQNLKNILDNVMKQRAQMNIGTTKKQAELISYEYEQKLWCDNVLGEQGIPVNISKKSYGGQMLSLY